MSTHVVSLRVESIADRLDLVPTVAKWHHDEWGHHDPGGTLESWTRGLAKRSHRDRIPTTFIALLDDEPVGSSVLVAHDMSTRLDLTPWLAGVFVVPEHRRKGIGRRLVTRAMSAARDFGIDVLYLYTNGAESFYEDLGWRRMAEEDYDGRRVTIMSAHLADRTGSDE